MELDKVINNRKTIRKFKDKNVSDEDVYKIIQSAMLAPSAKNRQPWRFYILDDQQKEDITNMMYQWDKEYPDIHTSIKGSANEMKSANKAIIIFTNMFQGIAFRNIAEFSAIIHCTDTHRINYNNYSSFHNLTPFSTFIIP